MVKNRTGQVEALRCGGWCVCDVSRITTRVWSILRTHKNCTSCYSSIGRSFKRRTLFFSYILPAFTLYFLSLSSSNSTHHATTVAAWLSAILTHRSRPGIVSGLTCLSVLFLTENKMVTATSLFGRSGYLEIRSSGAHKNRDNTAAVCTLYRSALSLQWKAMSKAV